MPALCLRGIQSRSVQCHEAPHPNAACSLTSMCGDDSSEMRAGIACSEMTSFLKNICRGCSSESSGVAAMRGPGVKRAIARAASICVVHK